MIVKLPVVKVRSAWFAIAMFVQTGSIVCRAEPANAGEQSLADLISDIDQHSPVHKDRVSIKDGLDPFSTPQIESLPLVTHHDQWMKSGKFQGDIAGIDPRYGITGDGRQYNAIRNRNLRWPDGVVPYVISGSFSQRQRSVIEDSLDTYHQRTCIRFVPRRAGQFDYLNIVKGYGCYSQVGRVRGRQEVSLGNGCIFHEIIVHELMHCLGMGAQFDKISTAYQDFLGETYDYESVMHYDSKAFSSNGRDTIKTVTPGFTSVIGTATDLSAADIRKYLQQWLCASGSSSVTHDPRDPRQTVTHMTHDP